MHPTSEFCKQMKESLKGRYELTMVECLEEKFAMGFGRECGCHDLFGDAKPECL